jgi:hypothetical protein
MDRATRLVLIAALLGASVVATGAVGRASMNDVAGRGAYASGNAEVAPYAVPYFPAQYVLDAPPGTSEPVSTF